MSVWCFSACFALTCCLVSGQMTKYVLVGGKVDFPGFSDNEESPTDILWKHIEGHKVQKVVHFDNRQEQSFASYEGRVTLDWHSADLSISNLRYEDSGSYDLEILINNQHLIKRSELIVIDKVTKPTISCEINNASTSESAGKATLLCSLPSYSDQSSLKFQWSTYEKINPGEVLKISLGGELDDRQYNCTVNNPLTQESAVFTAKDCYPRTKAQAGLIAGVVVGVLLLILLLILLLFCLWLICFKKVCSNHETSDLESQSNPGFSKVAGSEETKGLLDSSCPKKNKDEASPPPPVSQKSNLVRNFSASQRETENANPKVIKKQALDDPADSENPNEMSNDQSLSEKPEDSEFSSPPAVSPHLDRPCSDDKRPAKMSEDKRPDILDKEDNPIDAEETKDALPGGLNGSEKNQDEDNRASDRPAVPQKSNIVRNFSALQKETGNTNPKVIKKQALDDPADSENPNEMSNDQSLSEKPEDSGFSSPPTVSPHLDRPCSDDKRPAKMSEDKRPDILDKEDNPIDAEETKDALPGGLNGSEKNKDEDNKTSYRPAVPQKSNIVRNFSALQKETGNTNPKVIKKQALDDPADSGNPNEMSNNQSLSEKPEDSGFSSLPAVSPHLDHPCSDDKRPAKKSEDKLPDILNKEDNPVDAEETKDALPGSEKNQDEDTRASDRPAVPPKSKFVRNILALQNETENTNPKVIKKQALDDPADSGNPNDMSHNQNSGSKKEELEFATPENDVQPPPVAEENSPMSQISPESSTKAEHTQDTNSNESSMTSYGESSAPSSKESKNDEQVPPASTPKKTDTETTVEEQKPL